MSTFDAIFSVNTHWILAPSTTIDTLSHKLLKKIVFEFFQRLLLFKNAVENAKSCDLAECFFAISRQSDFYTIEHAISFCSAGDSQCNGMSCCEKIVCGSEENFKIPMHTFRHSRGRRKRIFFLFN
jgi:hypothetical protein